MALSAQLSVTAANVQKAYIAFFGRPADAQGLTYWLSQASTGASMVDVMSGFSKSDEFVALYPDATPNGNYYGLVNAIYENLFGRPAEAGGAAYWVGTLVTGQNTIGQVAYIIASNAQGTDATAVNAKVAFSSAFTTALYADVAAAAAYDASTIELLRGVVESILTTAQGAAASTTVAIDALLDTVIAYDTQMLGSEQILTAVMDDVHVSELGRVDTVKGTIDFEVTGYSTGSFFGMDGENTSTFSIGDDIVGNGLTKVELLVDVDLVFLGEDLSFFGEDGIEADFVEMSGVDELNLVNAGQNGRLFMDASSYGSDISEISLSGRDYLNVDIENLKADDTLHVSVDADSYIEVSGEWAGINFFGELSNNDSTSSSFSLAADAVSLNSGVDAYTYLDLDKSASGDEGGIVGDMVVGDINVVTLLSGEADVSITLSATNTNTGGAAKVGNLTIGDISIKLGVDSTDNDFSISQAADSDYAAATVGNLTIGDITLVGADGGGLDELVISQEADSVKGAATIGNIVIGDTNMSFGKGDMSEDDGELFISRSAEAVTTGNAVIGNALYGDVTITAVDGIDDINFRDQAYAIADKGNATVGTLAMGDILLTAGAGDGDNDTYSVDITRTAFVDLTGAASVGAANIGDITLSAGNGQELDVYVFQSAESDKGNATVGSLTVGDIRMTVGDDGTATASADFQISISADAVKGNATIGALTVGDVVMTGGDYANLEGYAYQWGVVATGNMTFGDLTVGDITFRGQVSSDLYFSVEKTGNVDGDGALDLGSVTVGDVSMIGVGSSYAGFGLFVTGYNESSDEYYGTIDNVTVGDVYLKADNNSEVSFWNTISAASIGDVTYGDISMIVGDDSYVDYGYLNIDAATGDVGDVEIGTIAIHLGTNSYLNSEFGLSISADDNIGDVTIGGIDFAAATSSEIVDFDIAIYAGDTLGNVTFGDVSLTALTSDNDNDGDVDLNVYISAEDDIGDVSFGDMLISADGHQSNVGLFASVTASNDMGDISIGDVTMVANDYESVAALAVIVGIPHSAGTFTHDFVEDIGNVTIGDLHLSVSGEDSDLDVFIDINSSTDNMGTTTIGDMFLTVANTEDAGDETWNQTFINEYWQGGEDYYSSNYPSNSNDYSESGYASLSVDIVVDGDLTVGNISLVQGSMEGWGANNIHYQDQYDRDWWYDDDFGGGEWEYSEELVAEDVIIDQWNDADMFAYVALSSVNGDLVVGDITVTGGYSTIDDGDYNDNYNYIGAGSSSWLDLSADGTITVGDVDYSDYERFVVIDMDQWKGAGQIMAGSDGSMIYDNAGSNVITLGAGSDEVRFTSSNTGKTATAHDQVIDFDRAEDTLYVNFNWNEFEMNSSSATVAQFLLDADTADVDIYAGKVGSDYYVAFDKDDNNSIDFIVKIVGANNVLESDFAAF